jgi:hypothetical protein
MAITVASLQGNRRTISLGSISVITNGKRTSLLPRAIVQLSPPTLLELDLARYRKVAGFFLRGEMRSNAMTCCRPVALLLSFDLDPSTHRR